MSAQITVTQKHVLHEAIDTLDASLIARCVLNIDVILVSVKVLLQQQQQRLTDDSIPQAETKGYFTQPSGNSPNNLIPVTEIKEEPPAESEALHRQSIGEPLRHQSVSEPLRHQSVGEPLRHQSVGEPLHDSSVGEPLHDSSVGEPLQAKITVEQKQLQSSITPWTQNTGEPLQRQLNKPAKRRAGVLKEPLHCPHCEHHFTSKSALFKHINATHSTKSYKPQVEDVNQPVSPKTAAMTSQVAEVPIPIISCKVSTLIASDALPIITSIEGGLGEDPQHLCTPVRDHEVGCLLPLDEHISTETSLYDTILDSRSTDSSSPKRSKPAQKRSKVCSLDTCTYTAGNKSEMDYHMRKLHPEHCERLRCEHCDFSTIKKANYRQHVRTHLPPEDKPYRCTLCNNYSSANKEGLRIHINSTHEGVKPYLCDTCGQSFTGISMLSKHKLMRHKPKHLQCPHCDYKTSLQNWLKDHMKRHSKETPFTCHFCSYSAKTAGRLKVHLRIHTGERPYKCHICDYGAMEGAPLKKHLKNQHQLAVKRIDIREGKFYTTSGEVIDTGMVTRTAPLPVGSFHGNKDMLAASHDTSDDGASILPLDIPNEESTLTGDATSIIAQAATLSALPVNPDSPTSPPNCPNPVSVTILSNASTSLSES